MASAEPATSGGEHERQAPRRRRLVFRVLQALALGLVAGLLALLGWRLVSSHRGPDLVDAIKKGNRPQAPSFSLPLIWRSGDTWPADLQRALGSDKLSLRQLRGRPVILNFWASWCGPCKEEAPRLAASAHAHATEVAFLGVDVQDLTTDARRFLRRFHVRYPSVRDNGGSTYDGYGLTGVPETYWIDGDGRIVAHYAGAVTREQLEQGIATAMESS